ncbi:MAG TPA: magnesium-translocating P-type ATPase [Gemmatimonadaceae bacterium]|nr:magnesium-translocating P-type ATPase [Gemmatimonadaceae bacterium]
MNTTTTSRGAPVAIAEFARLPAPAVLERLGVTRVGLTETAAQERTEQFGENKVAHEAPPTWYFQLGHAFWNPFIGVLIALGVLSYLTGDLRAVIVIGVMVTISALLRFVQEYRSNQAALALQAIVRTRATVERVNDATEEDPAPVPTKRELPIEAIVPGDIVHVSAGDMIPADVRFLSSKDLFISQSALTGEAIPVEKTDAVPEDGSMVSASLPDLRNIGFMGTSVVSGTAAAVVLATGDHTYFGSMAKGLVGQRPETSFDIGVNKVSWLLIKFMAVMVPIVFVINGISKHNWLDAFMFGLAVAVGLTPEMLPMIVTANLAKGAVTMARRKTIVKRLNAIQNFGAMDVLCTDKTGTLTQDKIVLEKHINVIGEEDDEVLNLAYLNSVYQTGLKNLLDVAILEKSDLNASLGVDTIYKKVDEIPFDFVRRRMSVVVERGKEVHELICKGAVEEILAVSTQIRDEDRIVPLDPETRETALEVVEELNEDGLRVVAVAYREFGPRTGAYTVADECELILAGFMAFLDPPKETAAPALRALKQYGVSVKILTGDNGTVTQKVCRDVGHPVGKIVNGSDLDALSDSELCDLAERTTVFAKLAPLQKTRVVKALRSRGHTVGFLGDGINDAGALREADVGISVDSAVDIAKESADIILLEKSLMVLEEGVLEGRKIFGNIIKYIKMTASSNFGNVFSVLVASAFLPFLPMLPIQLLVLNLLYDISQTSIPFDDMDSDYLLVPRKWSADDIGRFMVTIGPTSSIFDMVTFAVMWWVFKADSPAHESLFQSGWFIESLLSQTLVVHIIRTAKIPFIQSRATWPVLSLTATIMLIGMVLPFLPLGSHLGLEPLGPSYFAWLLVILGSYIALMQVVKAWYMRKYHGWL